MKAMTNLWRNWMTGKEKISMLVLILSCIISVSLVGIITRALVLNWNVLPAAAIGALIFLMISQIATVFYGVSTITAFVDDRKWQVYWYNKIQSDNKEKEL